MAKKIKFAINETLDTIVGKITEILPGIKVKWEVVNEEEAEKDTYFTTFVNGVEIKVYPTKVIFTINREGYDSDTRTFVNMGRNRKPAKIRIFEILKQRFNLQDDFRFYRRVLAFINGYAQVEKNKNGIQFTEQRDSEEDL